jgi:DNA-binding NtrC family response regulator
MVAFVRLKRIGNLFELGRLSTKSLSILVADDEDSIRSLLEHFLTAAGHRVVIVASAREACEEMATETFDLAITDVLMPDGDGLDLITQLRKKQPNARILAMSGGGRYLEGSDYLKLAKGLGAHNAMMKPFTWQQLQTAIEAALASPPDSRSAGDPGIS